MSNGMGVRPGGPSPPNSIGGRSSYGTTMSSGEHKKRQTLQTEDKMMQHYTILKRFLGQSLRDEKGNLKPNRARDKLLRLSGIQFQELSTDVFDELLRRQSASGPHITGPGQVPPYLLPKDNFHPKRNQARQKLATLPLPRFRDLATDVFYELERRFPSFPGREIARNGSPSMGPPSRSGTPNGMRPSGYQPRNQSLSGQVMGGMGIPPGGPEDPYGRPTAKQFQSNTIIPNKSTMVEDDDDDGLSDVYASRRDTTFTARSAGGSDKDRKAIGEYETQVNELQEKVKELEDRVRDKDSELEKAVEEQRVSSNFSIDDAHQCLTMLPQSVADERERFSDLQQDLEDKLQSAIDLNNNLRSELDRVKGDHATSERDLRAQVDAITSQAHGGNEWKTRYEALDTSHQDLRSEISRREEEFSHQEKVTNEVRQEAASFINQMKSLSERTTQSVEREEKLVTQVQRLENELKDWKNRYARVKTQANAAADRSIESPDAGALARKGSFTAADGLIKDMHMVRYQMAIDELLQSARQQEPQDVLPHVKTVVIAVRDITMDVGDTTASNDEVTQMRHSLKTRVSGTTNNLITAARNFSVSQGLSPVSLLDAAASHLSMSIIELVHLVNLRRSFNEELDDDANSDIVDSPADYYGLSNARTSGPGRESTYSTESSKPHLTSRAFSGSTQRKPLPNGISNGVLQKQPSVGYMHASDDGKIEELKVY